MQEVSSMQILSNNKIVVQQYIINRKDFATSNGSILDHRYRGLWVISYNYNTLEVPNYAKYTA